jgi:hypothetical protein
MEQAAIVDVSEISGWQLNPSTLALTHASGGFFTFVGYQHSASPKAGSGILISQNEIGLLLLFTSDRHYSSDSTKLLVCRKYEPGNDPLIQLSPSIQMTYSNIKGLHGASSLNSDQQIIQGADWLSFTLQTEQADSFLHKKNINACGYLPKQHQNLVLTPQHEWIDIPSLCSLLLDNRKVHIDLRVTLFPLLARIFKREHLKTATLHDPQSLLRVVSTYAFKYQLPWRLCPLSDIATLSDGAIHLDSDVNVRIIGVEATCEDREVSQWQQPLLELPSKSFGLVYTHYKGDIAILASIVTLPGLLSEPELQPTFCDESTQIDTSNLIVVHSCWQTEEGGRFWRRSNHNSLHFLSNNDTTVLEQMAEGPDRIWLTLTDIDAIYHSGNLVSIELRSIVSVLLAFLLSRP